MANETNELSVQQKIDQFNTKLEEYLESKKLVIGALDSEITEILSLSHDVLKRLSPVTLAEYSFLLAKYGTFIRIELNKERSALNWAKSVLNYIVLPRMSEYRQPYMSIDEVKMRATKDNEVAVKFYTFIMDAEKNTSLLDGIAYDVIKMAETLSSLQRARSFNHG